MSFFSRTSDDRINFSITIGNYEDCETHPNWKKNKKKGDRNSGQNSNSNLLDGLNVVLHTVRGLAWNQGRIRMD